MVYLATALLVALLVSGCTTVPSRYTPLEVVGQKCDESGQNCRVLYSPIVKPTKIVTVTKETTTVTERGQVTSSTTTSSTGVVSTTQMWFGQGVEPYYQQPMVTPCCLPKRGEKWYRW